MIMSQRQRNKKPGGKGNTALVLLTWMKFISKYGKSFKVVKKIKDVRNKLALINMKIAKMDQASSEHRMYCNAFDQAMLYLNAAKHNTAKVMENGDKAQIKHARDNLSISENIVNEMRKTLEGSSKISVYQPSPERCGNTEILFFKGAPIVPEINPVIVLKGTDFEMGYQYAEQVVEIFGPLILMKEAGKIFHEDEQRCLKEWEKQLEKYAPELIEMCRGWAAGATAAGVPMSYHDVLDIWTGHKSPADQYYGAKEGPPESINPPACSGLAAWGKATSDGKLVAGASGDHDCSFMATIVAYPQTGNSFIYTPFSVIGKLPNIGPVYMMGHPGMNSKGVAYVHHGGAPKMVESKANWGYGIRLGSSIFHNLRFANSAKEALAMDLNYPAGDVGERSGVGTAGGFYADTTYGYVAESRCDPVVIREAGMAGETDFLYANNSVVHPDAKEAGWLKSYQDNWAWNAQGGWYPKSLKNLQGAKAASMEAQIQSAMSYVYITSRGRNEYAYQAMNRSLGKIDLECMKRIYRNSGTVPQGDWEKITREYNRTGKWDGTYSVGHASNATVAVMKPDDGSEGTYSFCVGTAARGVAPISPTMCTPIYHETNAFWELKLDSSPQGMAESATQKAAEYLNQACTALKNKGIQEDHYLHQLLQIARHELDEGVCLQADAEKRTGTHSISTLAKAIRLYTRAQVHALQVIQTLIPQNNN